MRSPWDLHTKDHGELHQIPELGNAESEKAVEIMDNRKNCLGGLDSHPWVSHWAFFFPPVQRGEGDIALQL